MWIQSPQLVKLNQEKNNLEFSKDIDLSQRRLPSSAGLRTWQRIKYDFSSLSACPERIEGRTPPCPEPVEGRLCVIILF